MDLKEFTDPLPKPWLNINANSVNVPAGGVGGTKYSQMVPVTIANVTGPVSFAATSSTGYIGSRDLPILPPGSKVHVRIYFNLNMDANRLVTIQVNVSGSPTGAVQYGTPTLPIITSPGYIDFWYVVSTGGLCLAMPEFSMQEYQGGSNPISFIKFINYTSGLVASPFGVASTLDFFCTFTAASATNVFIATAIEVDVYKAS